MTESAWPDFPPLPVNGSNKKPRKAPSFAEPEPLEFTSEEKEHIEDTIQDLYRGAIEDRAGWSSKHQDYDLMFRGALDIRGEDAGPWPGSSNLHVQMPYWLVDSYSTRLVSGVFGQTPQVTGYPVEDDDQEVARDAAELIKWHLDSQRMNARANWARISKTRCIHGRGVGMLPWAKDSYTYRVQGQATFERDEDDNILVDEEGIPQQTKGNPVLERQTNYDGPLLIPVEWDDVLEPMEGINLQPVTPANPLGADWVGIRTWESLSQIWKKRDSSYSFIEGDKEDWINEKPSQDRSGGNPNNQVRVKLHDHIEGRTRSQGNRARSSSSASNPEFEILTWMMPWELENEEGEMEEAEVVFFYRVEPKMLIGAFRLSDLQWKNRRPLVELDFQTVGNRRLSMGICEIVADLSAELDTIHNMRMDVGFATNMPFFFFRATSTINPDRIVLRPGKGIPVDDVRDVHFPQLQSVTSFYNQEEQLLYSLVERVLGVTDLFLGVSPTRGAAARHATGFVGTQQEAMARTEEIMSSDSTAFSKLCHMIYEAEIQFGPPERIMRLQGEEGPLTQKLTRNELMFRGEYDFVLGSNYGLYSSMLRQQQAQILQQFGAQSPLINQDPGRRWEMENFIYHAYGFPNPEQFIGPKSAVSAGSPTDPTEENGQMDQYIYGAGVPAPVNPADNDQDHLKKHMDHINSEVFISMGRPNLQGHLGHIQATQSQMSAKQQQQQMAMMSGMEGGQQPQQQQQPNARNVASLEGVESAGAMGDMGGSPGGPPPAAPPPQFGGNGQGA